MTEQNDNPEPVDPSVNTEPPPPLASNNAVASQLDDAGSQENQRAPNEARIPPASPFDAPDLAHRTADIPNPVPERNPSEDAAIQSRVVELPSPESIIPRSSMDGVGMQTMPGVGHDQQTVVWEVWPRPTFYANVTDNGYGISATYRVKEVCHVSGMTTFSGGREVDAIEVNNITGIATGTKVLVSQLRGPNGYGFYFDHGGGGGGGGITLALITAVSAGTYAANSGAWTYTGNIVGGATGVTLRNKCEVTAGDVGANTRYGNGVWIVKTTGQVVGSDCFIIPLGVGIIVHCWPDPDNEGDYAFSLPNSAEIPVYTP